MEVKYPASTEQFLSGGGELGERIRSMDWEKTPLGPVHTWPQSLRTCVRIILTSRQPMFVWWGPQLINIYNDAYKAIVGGKHPEALGQPASVVWREIWDQVGPRAATVMNKNEGTYDEALLLIMERNGYPEETYYTFSYSPVPGDTGDTAGIICANTDDTGRIIGERQLRTLKDLGKNIADVKNEADVYNRAMQVLKENPQDFPFVLLYRVEEGNAARLIYSSETKVSAAIAPEVLDLNKSESELWPVSQAISNDKPIIIDNIAARIGTLPAGAWEKSPDRALVLPISQSSSKQPYALLLLGVNPYRLLDEKYLSFFQLVTDQIATSIGSVHALEEERKRAEALAEIDKAKTAFFSNVSHEFRTPLTLMLGPLEDLLHQSKIELPDEFTESISATHRNAMRLLKLVNTLLDFSRIEAGRIQAQYRPIDLAAFTTDLASSFRSIIEKAGLQYEVSCEEIKEDVYADQEMWEKIVLNLLSNAFKYTLEGSIQLSLKQQGHNVVLTVADTGTGIPEDELPRMFERFHRVPNLVGRTHEGTGIGLSLVNELVKLHGGTIQVSSEFGKGSAFTVAFPTGKAHLQPQQVMEDDLKHKLLSRYSGAFLKEAEGLLETASPGIANELYDGDEVLYSGLHENGTEKDAEILVVDDNPDMRTYLQRLLQGSFHVRTAENGRAALEKVQIKKPDLILSDIMMPVMDGKELLKELKGTIQTSRIPVILLSARAGEEARIDGLDAGADDYVVKPFSAKELLSKVKSQIAIFRTRYQAEAKLTNLFIQAPVAIVIFRGPEYVTELANDKYLEIIQRGPEFIGKPFFEAIPELKDQGIKELFDKVYTTGEPIFGNETRYDLLTDGVMESRYFNFVWQPIREQDGTINGIIAAVHEVTTQVMARLKIEESEQRLDLALESSQMGVWDLNIVNKTLIRSQRYIEIVGYEEEYRPGYGLTQYVFPADKAYVEQAYHEAFMTGKLNMQFRLVQPDGSIRWLDSRGKVYFNEKNEPVRMLGTIADITERKETERQKDEFMSIVSHELKTPVTSLKAFGQVLQSRFLKEGDERSASLLGKMDTQINKLTTLIRDLLDDTKIQHGKLQFHEEPFNMNELVDEIIEEIQRTTTKHNIIKENTIALQVFGDRERVGQILTNLIGNAIKYSPEADKINVRCTTRKDELVCSVQDFGIGVPPDMHDKVFDRFFRAYGEKHTTFPGLGLGLHISSEIIKRLGGEIWMESQEGQGSTFHFSLPLYRN